jgi:hypothetical protein
MQPQVSVAGRRPDGWVDKTMIVYSAPPAPGQVIAPNIVIARDALGADETFRDYCNRQIEGFRATLPHFLREEEGAGRVREHDAFQIRFLWQSGAGMLRQRVFFIAADAGVVVTYTATAAADDYAAHEPVFERGLAELVVAPAARH